mmetsp:Transcript_34926/g.104947  ORF Transcript_34926/g.104947 Transcript_34926/m.104947 type:complete len:285 (+) Transcript_34926:1054-1908(+)
MKVTAAGFAQMTQLLLSAVDCPVAAALEGGYNSRVTCECCEAVLRVLLGSSPPATSPTLLAPSVEPTLRSVLAHNAPHWSGLRYSEKAVQDFFAEAARVGSAPRVSKRQRTAPAFADEERANPRAAEQQKLAEKRAVREAARGAAEEERAESAAALARAEREVKAARRRCREAEEGLQAAEGRLAAAREAHALLERGAGGKEEEEESAAKKAAGNKQGREERAKRRAEGGAAATAGEGARPATKRRAASSSAAAPPPEPLSEYEKQRDATKARNQRKLEELGLA